MRKQAEQLVVGRVYADTKGNIYEPVFMKFVKYVSDETAAFSYVSGSKIYPTNQEGLSCFLSSQGWYELTPEDEKELNLTPSDPTFTLSDIQRVIERIENEMAECGYTLTEHGLRIAIEIMREELKIK